MSFNIEQMKQDGVSQHLIDFLSMHPMAAGVSIARRLEHDLLFTQLMTRLFEAGTSLMTFEELAPYAAAAGMISRADKEWICDNANTYAQITHYTITFDANGGSNPPAPMEIPIGGALNSDRIDSGSMTAPIGNMFYGWSLTDTNEPIDNLFKHDAETGENALFVPTSDTTLYAIWGPPQEI